MGGSISTPANPFDGLGDLIKNGLRDGFREFGDILKREIVDAMIRDIYEPIDRDLIQPSARAFEMMKLYINCSKEKAANFFECFVWYVIYITQKALYMICQVLLMAIKALPGGNGVGNAASDAFDRFLGWFEIASEYCYEFIGFYLFVFPYSDDINAKCFVCEAVNKQHNTIKDKMIEGVKWEISNAKNKIESFLKENLDPTQITGPVTATPANSTAKPATPATPATPAPEKPANSTAPGNPYMDLNKFISTPGNTTTNTTNTTSKYNAPSSGAIINKNNGVF